MPMLRLRLRPKRPKAKRGSEEPKTADNAKAEIKRINGLKMKTAPRLRPKRPKVKAG